MKKLTILAGLLSVASAWAQPVLRATDPVVNGASYANTIAPGSIFVIFGTNIGGDAVVLAPGVPYPVTLGTVSVKFTPVAGGAALDALMIYTTKNQISGLLPSSAAAGDYNVAVTFNGRTSPNGRAKVVARNYGIVTADSSGGGQAQAQGYRTATAWDLNRFATGNLGPFTTAPATIGQTIVLWGTGLGADSASDTTGGTSGDRTAAASIRVVLGGREIVPGYAGRSSGLPGTDQINFVIPAGTEPGCSVPVQLKVGDVLSNTVTLAVVNAGQTVCSHPSLSSDALKRLSEGGSVVLGSFALTKQTTSISVAGFTLDNTSESMSGDFARYTVGNVADFSASGYQLTTIGACTVFRRTGDQNSLVTGVPPATLLDAGASLRLAGPNSVNITVPRGPTSDNTLKNYYSYTQNITGGIPGIPGIPGGGSAGTSFIAAGTYTLSGTGGADVGSFTSSITVPTPLVWTNSGSISNVTRSQALPITWTGGGSNNVMIFGVSGSQVGGTQTNPIYDVAGFNCLAAASAGNFSVPSSVLQQLPAGGDVLAGGIGLLGVQVIPATGGVFTAPLTAGGSTDAAAFAFSIGTNKTVTYR